MFIMFPDQNFRLNGDMQNVSELHSSLASFYVNREKDNKLMIESGQPYPLSIRLFQMGAAITLQQALIDTQTSMKLHAEKYKFALSAGLTEAVVISCIEHASTKLAATSKELRQTISEMLTQVKGEVTASAFAELQTSEYAQSQDIEDILKALNQLAKNLGTFKTHYNLFL